MSAYDFTSCYDRKRTKASKWVQMLARKPDVKEGVVPMTVADMDFMTAPEIVAALEKYPAMELLGYSRPTNDYLGAVVDFYQKEHGYQAQKEWIFTTPGVVPALASAVRTLTKPGEGVILLTPIYGPFFDVTEGQGRKAAICPMQVVNNRLEIDFACFEQLCREENNKLFLLCSPHNPSGRVWTREELTRLADICEKYQVHVASDEIHSDIVMDGHAHTVFNTVSEYAGKAILCTSAGKTFNIQALQCANVFIKDKELRDAYERDNLYAGIERANVMGMVGTAAAYRDALPWRDAVTRVIAENHQTVLDFFAPYAPRIQAMAPDASFLVWVDFSGMGVAHEEFFQFMTDCDFFVSDGNFFGPGGEKHFRLNVGLPAAKLKENLARLKQGLKERYGM